MLKTQRGFLGPLWKVLYAATIRVLSESLRCGGTAYVRGSFASGEPVFGLSDIDLVIVVPDPARGASGDNRARVIRRWQRFSRPLPLLRRVVVVNVYEETPLSDVCSSTVLTYGLDRPAGAVAPLFQSSTGADRHFAMRVKPGLYGASRDWRRVAGPERRPPVRTPTGVDRLMPAWLELQCWWRYAFWASVERDRYAASDLCVKLVAEPARIWLWLVCGEQHPRRESLGRMLDVLPEEEPAIRTGMEMWRRPAPDPVPLEPVLAYLVRMSSRLAELVEREAIRTGTTRVRLHWPDRASRASASRDRATRPDGPLPLVDWRALVFSEPPWERFAIRPGSPASPAAIADVARSDTGVDPVPALSAGDLLVMPTLDIATRPLIRGALRAVQCPATDPVSFALAADETDAVFPNLPGWSIADGARRALTEHLGRLTSRAGNGGDDVAMVFAALRSLLLFESVASGQPELPLTVSAVAERLAGIAPETSGLVQDAADLLEGGRSEEALEPSPRIVDALAGFAERRARAALGT